MRPLMELSLPGAGRAYDGWSWAFAVSGEIRATLASAAADSSGKSFGNGIMSGLDALCYQQYSPVFRGNLERLRRSVPDERASPAGCSHCAARRTMQAWLPFSEPAASLP